MYMRLTPREKEMADMFELLQKEDQEVHGLQERSV